MLSFAHVHAGGYARQVSENERAQLVAIWDHMEDRGKNAAKQHEVPFYGDLDEILKLDIDAVVVNVETNRHPEVMIAAAEAGKHIFTEKALAITVEECDEIIEAVEAAGVKFMISLPSRCRKELLLAKKAVDDGLLGDITFGRGRVAHSASLDRWFSGGSAWFVDAEQAGGTVGTGVSGPGVGIGVSSGIGLSQGQGTSSGHQSGGAKSQSVSPGIMMGFSHASVGGSTPSAKNSALIQFGLSAYRFAAATSATIS